MKTNSFIAILFIAALGFTSCEKVIDIPLKTAARQIVIEGIITDQAEQQSVRLSRTVDFTEKNVFPAISGAAVSVSDDAGHSWTFAETGAGNYTSFFAGQPGRRYTLKANIEGKVYTASSVMPAVVNLDSLDIKEFTFGGSVSKQAQAHYKDPAGIANYYRFTLKLNGKQSPLIYSENDRFTDGNEVKTVLFREEDHEDKIHPGDSVDVEMQCIDKQVFNYWFTLTQQTQNGPGGSTTPGNPPSNISNGALGYFSAQTKQEKGLRVK